jgi:hypothetical protein
MFINHVIVFVITVSKSCQTTFGVFPLVVHVRSKFNVGLWSPSLETVSCRELVFVFVFSSFWELKTKFQPFGSLEIQNGVFLRLQNEISATI